MSKVLVDFYQSVLETAGLTIADGVVQQHLPDEGDVPVTVSKKTLVLPIEKWLNEPEGAGLQFFHPIAENVIRKESVVFKFLRRLVVINTTALFLETMQDLMHILVTKETHQNLDAITQLPLLRTAPDADKDLKERFGKIIDKIDPTGDNAFMSLVILRGKSLKDKDYIRVAKVTFPLFDAILNAENNQIFGVKLRKKDITALKNLFQYVLPELNTDPEFYSTGSRSGVAPSFHALLGTYLKLVDAVNKIRRDFGWEEEKVTWRDELNDFSSFKGLLPKLPGNDGEHVDGEETQPTNTRGSRPAATTSYRATEAEEQPRAERESESTPQGSTTSTSTRKVVSMGEALKGSRLNVPAYTWMNDEEREGAREGRRRDSSFSCREERHYRETSRRQSAYGSGFSQPRNNYNDRRRHGGGLF